MKETICSALKVIYITPVFFIVNKYTYLYIFGRPTHWVSPSKIISIKNTIKNHDGIIDQGNGIEYKKV